MSTRKLTLAWIPALLLAVALPMGCEKPGPSNNPGDVKGGGIKLEYSNQPFKLQAAITLGMELSGSQTGNVMVSGTSTIATTSAGGGKIKLTGEVTAIEKFEVGGDLKPKEGDPQPDPQRAVGTKAGRIMAVNGEVDEDASKDLPENDKDENASDADKMVRQFAEGMVALPELPPVGLVLGKPVKHSETKDRTLGPMKIPVESDSTYTLESIDESGGSRVATIKINSTGSGATEISGQGQTMMISMDEEAEGTLIFDLDRGVPVSWTARQTVGFGSDQFSIEQIISFDAKFSAI